MNDLSGSDEVLRSHEPRSLAGVFAMMEEVLPSVEAAWVESDERRRKVERVEDLLKRGDLPSPFDSDDFIEGLRLSLGFFQNVKWSSWSD